MRNNRSIFLIDSSGALDELCEEKYECESVLQDLLEEYPSLLAGDQIDSENPRRFALISREMGVPDSQDASDHWALDHLFIDQYAVPTLVEVKISPDSHKRRLMVGQILDYAANGTKYWSAKRMMKEFERTGSSLSDLGIHDASAEEFWLKAEENLRLGKIRLLLAVEKIPKDLKTTIEFLNDQMVHTEVLGLEISQFTSETDKRILVSRIVGQSEGLPAAKNKSIQAKKEAISRDEFLEAIQESIPRGYLRNAVMQNIFSAERIALYNGTIPTYQNVLRGGFRRLVVKTSTTLFTITHEGVVGFDVKAPITVPLLNRVYESGLYPKKRDPIKDVNKTWFEIKPAWGSEKEYLEFSRILVDIHEEVYRDSSRHQLDSESHSGYFFGPTSSE